HRLNLDFPIISQLETFAFDAIALMGLPIPDHDYYYGHTLLSSLQKYGEPNERLRSISIKWSLPLEKHLKLDTRLARRFTHLSIHPPLNIAHYSVFFDVATKFS